MLTSTQVSMRLHGSKNPKILYAAAHQRRRHVYTYVGGGPGSSLYNYGFWKIMEEN